MHTNEIEMGPKDRVFATGEHFVIEVIERLRSIGNFVRACHDQHQSGCQPVREHSAHTCEAA
jgi:hypothetical protein